jgi:hypothetical protein
LSSESKNFDRLLREICVGLGYCGSVVNGQALHVSDFIPQDGPVSADEFVWWVMRAEGFEPGESPHERQIRDAFIRHMGGEVVDARLLA